MAEDPPLQEEEADASTAMSSASTSTSTRSPPDTAAPTSRPQSISSSTSTPPSSTRSPADTAAPTSHPQPIFPSTSTPPSSSVTPATALPPFTFDASSHPRRSSYFLPSSLAAFSTLNPIRAIVDRIVLPTDLPHKPLIPLSIGDPTTFGNLEIPENAITSLIANLKSKRYNGYAPSSGALTARQAIAQRYSYPSPHTSSTACLPPTTLTPSDVLITSGCSGALSIAIEALCNPGSSLLIPRPGFSLYRTILGRNGIHPRYYNLLPERGWEVDLAHLESLIDDSTIAILLNNPGNPTGANWSRQHIEEVLEVARRHRLPIIADEVYAGMVFEGQTYWPIAALSREVPVVSVGGIAKAFVCPGWRLGWVLVYAKGADCSGWREGMANMSQLIIGANTLVQSTLPDLLHHTPPSYHQQLMASLQASATYLYEQLNTVPALSCALPQGAMYLLVRVDVDRLVGMRDEVEFAQALLREENVFVLPGSVFQAPGYVRLVCCAGLEVMAVAVQRMREFCHRHSKDRALRSDDGDPDGSKDGFDERKE